MENINDILLFKTNIDTPADKHILQSVLDNHPHIKEWCVDLDDEDKILRIISTDLTHAHVIEMITLNGYHCEELKD
jgi:hypothetical protein